MAEKSDIGNLRLIYLQNVHLCREKGGPGIYMDESYFHSSATKSDTWNDIEETVLDSEVDTHLTFLLIKRCLICMAVSSESNQCWSSVNPHVIHEVLIYDLNLACGAQ
jgi:hypothetical protein